MSSVEPTPRGRRVVAAVVAAAVLVVVVAVAAVILTGRGSDRVDGPLGASTPPSPASATDQETTGSRTSPTSNSSPTTTKRSTEGAAGAGETTSASLNETAETGQGVTVKVTKIEHVEGKANGPGEIAGPAVRLNVHVANGSPKQLSMELALVNVYYGKARTPAASLSGPRADPLAGSIDPGGSASGRYVFGVPRSKQDQLTVEFSYTTDAPTVIFSE
jgi:hypothetical protein